VWTHLIGLDPFLEIGKPDTESPAQLRRAQFTDRDCSVDRGVGETRGIRNLDDRQEPHPNQRVRAHLVLRQRLSVGIEDMDASVGSRDDGDVAVQLDVVGVRVRVEADVRGEVAGDDVFDQIVVSEVDRDLLGVGLA
jgi:hypothetical protein